MHGPVETQTQEVLARVYRELMRTWDAGAVDVALRDAERVLLGLVAPGAGPAGALEVRRRVAEAGLTAAVALGAGADACEARLARLLVLGHRDADGRALVLRSVAGHLSGLGEPERGLWYLEALALAEAPPGCGDPPRRAHAHGATGAQPRG